MIYESIPYMDQKAILTTVFGGDGTHEDKKICVFSAIFSQDSDFVVDLFMKILSEGDSDLTIVVVRAIPEFMQVHKTEFGGAKFLSFVTEFSQKNPRFADEMTEICSDIKEFQVIFRGL